MCMCVYMLLIAATGAKVFSGTRVISGGSNKQVQITAVKASQPGTSELPYIRVRNHPHECATVCTCALSSVRLHNRR